jgi:patatin-like phospholipase/acyl hydrolase
MADWATLRNHGSPKIFRSRGLAGGDTSDETILEAVLASAAAPTYFPPQEQREETIIDGGLIANAPKLLALCEGCGKLAWRIEDTYALALGTASRREGAALTSLGRPSVFSWMVRRKLFQATMAAQEVLATAQCKALLGERYLRIDREPAENQVPAIRDFDRATTQAKKTLQSLANESWNEYQGEARVRGFFSQV